MILSITPLLKGEQVKRNPPEKLKMGYCSWVCVDLRTCFHQIQFVSIFEKNKNEILGKNLQKTAFLRM